MRRIRIATGLALGLFLALVALAPSAQAQLSAENGKLVSQSTGAGGGCLKLLNPDGSGSSQPGACGFETSVGSLGISPDGTRIAGPVFFYDPEIDDFWYQIRVSNLDGGNAVLLAPQGKDYVDPEWAPDASLIAVERGFIDASCGLIKYQPEIVRPDGGSPPPGSGPGQGATFAWSNDNQFAWYTSFCYEPPPRVLRVKSYQACCESTIYTTPSDGGMDNRSFDWSPTSDRLAVGVNYPGHADLLTMNPDGSGVQTVNSFANNHIQDVRWSPDGQKIMVAQSGTGIDIYTINPDGSGLVNITAHPAWDVGAYWSPDSQKIAFSSQRTGNYEIFTVNRDGTGLFQVTNTPEADWLFGWQPVLRGYPRPKGAGTLHAPLVPAYATCVSPNRVHSAPLSYNSCNPPTRASTQLTLGTPDANGRAANSNSSLRIGVVPGNPGTPADEAEARFTAAINDVRLASDLSDYTGNLEARVRLQITDRSNTPYPGGPGPGTVQGFDFTFTIPCAATADPNVGSTCNLLTTADTLLPGSVLEGRRAIWETNRIEVGDGAGQPFLRQGIFIP